MRYRIVAIGLTLLLLVVPLPLFAAPLLQTAQLVRISQVDISDYPRVTLYVNVVDATGQVVEGLQAKDFQVLEEGQSARVVSFAGLGEQRPVDIVFVLDTTSSMGSYIEGVKQTCTAFAQTLASRQRDYRLGLVTFGDTVREHHPFTNQVTQFIEWISAQQAEGGGDDQENALGAVQDAAAFPYRPGAQRLILLITDAPAHHAGDAADETATFNDPNLTLERTVALLQQNSISVHALTYGEDPDFRQLADRTGGGLYSIYEDFTGLVDRLGVIIANQYRFAYESPRPAYDGSSRQVEVTVGGQKGTGTYTTPSAYRAAQGSVQLYNALRTPLQISTDPKVIGTNAFLAILIALLFGLTSTVLNDTLNSNRDAFERSLLGRAAAAIKKFGQMLARPLGQVAFKGKKVVPYLQVAAFLLVTALIACFLEPSFRFFTWPSVGVFFAMLFSVGLVNLVYEGSQVVAARRFHLDAALKLNPSGIVVALGCVLLSRLAGFVPGYLYGVAGGYALGSAVELGRRREATISGTALGATLLLALLAWGLTVPTSLLQGALGAEGVGGFFGGIVGGLQNGLLTIFFVGLEVVFLEMFPVQPTNGSALFAWNKVAWGLGFGAVAFIAFHTLLTPDSAYLDTVRNTSLDLLLGMLFLFSVVTVALWYFLEKRKQGQAPAVGVCPTCGHDNGPAARFCSECGTSIPTPTPASVQRGFPRHGRLLVILLGALWALVLIAVLLAALGVG
jgi:VWFA-related protein